MSFSKNCVPEFLAIQRFRLDSFFQDVHSEAGENRIFQAFEIPIVGMGFGRAKFIDQAGENARNIIFKNQVLLIDTFEQAAAQSIDGLALLVHHIVVFEQMLASFEVLPFDRLLCSFNAAADQLRFNRNSFFHPQALEKIRDPLFGEDAHEVIFERKVETRRSRIPLAAGAASELVIDAPGLVALGAKNVQATGGNDFVMLFVGLELVTIEGFGPLIGRHTYSLPL